MMDIDTHDTRHTSGVGEEGSALVFTCASCAKRVCDFCAVRGYWRVCLGCANRGGGSRSGHGNAHATGNMIGVGYGEGGCGMEVGVRGAGGGGGGAGGKVSSSGIGNVGKGMATMHGKRWVGGIGWC